LRKSLKNTGFVNIYYYYLYIRLRYLLNTLTLVQYVPASDYYITLDDFDPRGWAINGVMPYAYFSDVIISCVEGRLSPVVASHLKFEFASQQPHVLMLLSHSGKCGGLTNAIRHQFATIAR
jgi:hypothetical protein